MDFWKSTKQEEAVEYVVAEDIATDEGLERYKRNKRGQLLLLINLQSEGRQATAELLEALIGIGIYLIPSVNSKGRATLKILPIIGKGYFGSIENWEQWRGAMLEDKVACRELAYIIDKAVSGQCNYDDCALRKVATKKGSKPKCQRKIDCLFVSPKCEYAEHMFEDSCLAGKARQSVE